jgi:hypothetical protein
MVPATLRPCHPPGRALASVDAGGTDPGGNVPHGRGNAVRFLVPPAPTKALSPHPGRGHRPCHSATPIPSQPGGQSPRPAPAPTRRALASAIPAPAGLRGTVQHGRGNAVRFLVPPAPTKALSPLSWQGPSPLPQGPADPWSAGGPMPPASARPAPGGRFSPAGSGAGLSWCGQHRSWWQRSARAGETRCVSGSRPDWGRKNIVRTTSPAAMAGAIAPATAPR